MSSYLNPRSQAAEAFRTLRTSLYYSAKSGDIKTLLVTSTGPGEGKTTVVSNLGISLSQAGEKVLLIDADLRKPRCHREFSLSNRRGLTNALVGSEKLDHLIQNTPVEGLSVLTSGPIPPNPAELLGSPAMDALLNEVKPKFDRILLDSPPAGPLADPLILASKVDGIILVLLSGETRIDVAQDVKDMLEKANGKIIGVVLNKVRRNTGDYRYRYYYYYGDEAPQRK